MVNILQFYKETAERPPEEQGLDKFGHSTPVDRSQYASPPTSNPASPTMYPGAYMGESNFDRFSELRECS